jgi:hypothetical protein
METVVMRESLGDKKREELFNILSANLQFVKNSPRVHLEPDIDEGIICPVCFKLYTRESLSKEYDDHLTLEDIPPKALGGTPKTLTCKVCNNWAGSQLEGHLVKKLQAEEILQGISDGRIESRFGPGEGIDLTATTSIGSDRVIDIRYDPKRSDPNQVEQLHKLEDNGEIGEIKLKIILGYKINRPEIALIRVAYLSAFSFFGYGFLMNPSLLYVRSQIQRSCETILPDWGILKGEFPDEALGINVINKPKELQSYLVVFDLKTEYRTTRHGVILPGPSFPGSNVYFRLAELRADGANTPVEYGLRGIPKDDYLTREDFAFAAHHYWDAFRVPTL